MQELVLITPRGHEIPIRTSQHEDGTRRIHVVVDEGGGGGEEGPEELAALEGILEVLGAVDDVGVQTNADGSVSAKLRGLITLFLARIPVLGSALKAAASPVTLATDDALYDRIGEVQATPTANTLLARLKAIQDNTDGLEGFVDGIEAGLKDAGPAWTTGLGVAGVPYTSADATANPAVTSAPTGGQKLVVTDIVITTGSVAMILTFTEETSGTVLHKVYMPANSTHQFTPRGKLKLSTADKKLMMDASAAGDIFCAVYYYSEA